MTIAPATATRDGLYRTAARWTVLFLSAVMVFHFFYLRTWGVGSFESIDRNLDTLEEAGEFYNTPFRDADGRTSIARYARSPAGRWMHIFPSGLWSVLAPIQLSPWMRSKYRTAHRLAGRVFIAMSFSMSVGLLCLIYSGATKVNDGPAGFYQFRRVAGSLLYIMYFFATAVLAIYYARRKQFARHRVWVLRHVGMGYSVHTFRMVIHFSRNVVEIIHPAYNDKSQEGAEIRDAAMGIAFAIAMVLSTGAAELWINYTKHPQRATTLPSKKSI